MKELKINDLKRGGSPAGGDVGFIEFESGGEQHRLIFSYQEADNFIIRMQQVKNAMRAERQKAGQSQYSTLLQQAMRFSLFPAAVEEGVMLRVHLSNGQDEDFLVHRKEMREILELVKHLEEGFEKKSQSRQ